MYIILNILRVLRYNYVEYVWNGLNININNVCVNLFKNNVYMKRNKNILWNIFCWLMKNIDVFLDEMINILFLFRINISNYYYFDLKYWIINVKFKLINVYDE